MTQETLNVLNELKKDRRQNPKLNIGFGIIAAISWVIILLGALIKQNGLVIFGLLVWSLVFLILLSRGVYALERKMSLKKSIQTMEKTGSIRYANEILNKQYKTTDKECLSEHIYYIPGTFIMAYEDILDIRCIDNTYCFITIDGKQHRIMGLRIKKETIEYLINTYNITSGVPYKEYKHKIDDFKKGVLR